MIPVASCLFPPSWPLFNRLEMVNRLMYLSTIPHLLLPSGTGSSTQRYRTFYSSGVVIGRKRATRGTVKCVTFYSVFSRKNLLHSNIPVSGNSPHCFKMSDDDDEQG